VRDPNACAICPQEFAEHFAGIRFCLTHLERVRRIAADAGVTMATEIRGYGVTKCAKCDREFTRTGPRSVNCNRDDCADAAEGRSTAPPKVARQKTEGRAPTRPQRRAVASSEAAEPDGEAEDAEEQLTAHDVIDAFGLDYNLGNVTRFVLEREDGDELENLGIAKTYLDRAIAKLAGAAQE
jgi:hypothetical protein